MNVVTEFADFIMESNRDGSNKAGSYLLALESVNKLLKGGYLPQFDITDIYEVNDTELLERVHRFLLDEGKRADTPLLAADIPRSHIAGRFCAGALYNLIEFRNNEAIDAEALEKCRAAKTPRMAAEAIAGAKVTARTFRKCVLENYGNACCLTGLDIRETLKAAIINPEARGKSGFSPDNALCLSATYAEAFKAHLITFDEKFRLVLSKSLKDHTTSAIFDATFKTFENTRIRPARHFQPNERYLAEHRELLVA